MSTKLDDLGGRVWSPGSDAVPAIVYSGTRKSTALVTVKTGSQVSRASYSTRGAFLDAKVLTEVNG